MEGTEKIRLGRCGDVEAHDPTAAVIHPKHLGNQILIGYAKPDLPACRHIETETRQLSNIGQPGPSHRITNRVQLDHQLIPLPTCPPLKIPGQKPVIQQMPGCGDPNFPFVVKRSQILQSAQVLIREKGSAFEARHAEVCVKDEVALLGHELIQDLRSQGVMQCVSSTRLSKPPQMTVECHKHGSIGELSWQAQFGDMIGRTDQPTAPDYGFN